MLRTHNRRITEIKERVRTRLRDGTFRPGDRFLSTRELARLYDVSYQTAHCLLDELSAEGWLERRAAAGTFVPGRTAADCGAQLLFHARARRPHSFGARLFQALTRRLDRDGIPWTVLWTDAPEEPAPDRFPILWEAVPQRERLLQQRRLALLLNDRPPPGLDAAFLDSVSVDDFSGGAAAAQLLLRQKRPDPRLATLTGPRADARSSARCSGFLSAAPHAAIVSATGWFLEDGLSCAAEAVSRGPDGLFCANDRLAEAVVQWCWKQSVHCPPLVGFDDAPIAEALNLTTIAIPWEELIAEAVAVLRRRLAGDVSAARQILVTPRPVVRGLFDAAG